jgi:crotonobetainyl-CoA:carnitine CoA-transferase CaiB-like acyl-CoA transferase
MITQIPHPLIKEGGGAKLISSPLRLSETPVTYRHHPPLLGEHTNEVLTEKLGLNDEELELLRNTGVIGSFLE